MDAEGFGACTVTAPAKLFAEGDQPQLHRKLNRDYGVAILKGK